MHQDLLKQIHFFASRYYASQNILLDSSRMHRKERKVKKMKDAAGGAEGEEDEGSVSPGWDEGQEEEEEEESTDDDETPDPPKKSASTKTTKRNAKLKRREKRRKELRRDMYKVFDGSALMVIGISSFLLFPLPD